MSSGAHESLLQEIRFHKNLWRPGTLIDIGAHTGEFASRLGNLPGLRIVLIEPLPWALSVLKEQAKAITCPVQIIAAALSDKNTRGNICVPVVSGSPIWPWASIVKDFVAIQAVHPEITDVHTQEIDIVTLDSLDLSSVSAIKIDAEGAEYEILSGATRTLEASRPIVSAELEERHRAGCTKSIPRFMNDLNYECFFEIDKQILPLAKFIPENMQIGSESPASHQYSVPYVSCFYFLPREIGNLHQRLREVYAASAPQI